MPKLRKFKSTATGQLVKCTFCDNTKAPYKCSRCELPYCSIDCFRTNQHLECSENFYKKLVFEHLKSIKNGSEEDKLDFIEMLKRNSTQSNPVDYSDILHYLNNENNFEAENELENYDILNNEQLNNFLKKIYSNLVNIDNEELQNNISIEKLWSQLNIDDQKEFIEIVNGNDKYFNKLINVWNPWWYEQHWQKVVTLLEDENNLDENDQERQYPQMFEKFEPISKLTSKPPSSTIATSILCTLFSYCYLCRRYNGEVACGDSKQVSLDTVPYCCLKWTVNIVHELYQLSPYLTNNGSLIMDDNPFEAIDQLLTRFWFHQPTTDKLENNPLDTLTERKTEAVQLLADVRTLVDTDGKPGRQKVIKSTQSNVTYHASKGIVLAISDLIHILSHIAHCLKAHKRNSVNKGVKLKQIELTKRKLQFYLSYSVEFSETLTKKSKHYLQAIDFHIEKLKQENFLFHEEEQITENVDNRTPTSSNMTIQPKLIEEIN